MSKPPFNPDDPRLTAYALGEAGEEDRQAVEKMIAESPEARAEVEQTRALAALLTAGYEAESEQYLTSRPDPERPSNIIPFRRERQQPWRRAVGPALKAAALLLLTASLVYVTLRRQVPSALETAASVPRSAPPPAATPPLVAMNQTSQSAVSATRKEEDADSARTPAVDKQQAAEQADPAASTTDTHLAMKDNQRTLVTLEQPPQAQAAEMSSAGAFPPPAIHLDKAPMMPSAVGAITDSAKLSLPDEHIAQSVVRIRSPEGVFFPGVLVSSDGLILSATNLSESALQPPCTVLLADGRELPGVEVREPFTSGWHLFRIDASALTPAPLATAVPAFGAPLSIPLVTSPSGAISFSHARAAEIGAPRGEVPRRRGAMPTMAAESHFAFTSAGELLLVDHVSARSVAVTRAKSAYDSSTAIPLRARPLTAAERSTLQSAVKPDSPK